MNANEMRLLREIAEKLGPTPERFIGLKERYEKRGYQIPALTDIEMTVNTARMLGHRPSKLILGDDFYTRALDEAAKISGTLLAMIQELFGIPVKYDPIRVGFTVEV